MVQIGNFHLGKAETATLPKINIGEAFILCQHLNYRYYCLEQNALYYKAAHDTEFKALIELGSGKLKKEVAEVTKQMEKYRIPLPSRMPQSIMPYPDSNDSSLMSDHFIYQQIQNGCIAAVQNNVNYIRSLLDNDSVRNMFIDFVKEELEFMTLCCKYAKVKGWAPVYPTYKAD